MLAINGETEKQVAGYIDSAIHEITMTAFLEQQASFELAQAELHQNEINESAEDDITIVNAHQPYTFKDGHYMMVGAPMNQLEVPDEHEGYAYEDALTAAPQAPVQQRPVYAPYSVPPPPYPSQYPMAPQQPSPVSVFNISGPVIISKDATSGDLASALMQQYYSQHPTGQMA